jgi:hypothetical protein
VWHLYCGGDHFGECTAEEIAAMWGCTRQRVEQIEYRAYAKVRRLAKIGNKDALNMLEWLRQKIELRYRSKPSHWDAAAAV